jgi:hypothetical protein
LLQLSVIACRVWALAWRAPVVASAFSGSSSGCQAALIFDHTLA